ncbi:MAG: hypothetical protein ABSF56_00570 [Minisyncoccia bacterium]|jgi:hypothetical protein
METKFQTSFIPKRPAQATIGSVAAAPRRRIGGNLYMTIAILAFVASLSAVGGAYLWKQYLLSAQATYRQQLSTREEQFNIDLIAQLKAESVKIGLAKQLLSNHLSTSEIFSIISRLTVENVRFSAMDVVVPTLPGNDITVTLSGYGRYFSTVAFQSDVLNQLDQYGLRHIVKNPIISNPSLNQDGTVSFGLTASIDPGSMSYKKSLTNQASSTSQ